MSNSNVIGVVEFANERSIDQIYQLYVYPELNRRFEAGTLSPDYLSAQADGQKQTFLIPGCTLVLLNDEQGERVYFDGECSSEAGLLLAVKMPASSEAKIGDELNVSELEPCDLRFEESNRGSAYIVVITQPGRAWLRFDLRRNLPIAKEHLVLGARFLHYCELANANGDWRPFVEFGFHASELLCKSMLLTFPTALSDDGEIAKWKGHKDIRQLAGSHLGTSFGQLLERFDKLRKPARYFLSKETVAAEEQNVLLQDLTSLFRLADRHLSETPNSFVITPDSASDV